MLVVTSLKRSESVLLRQRFATWFNNEISVLTMVSVTDLSDTSIEDYDVIFTTEQTDLTDALGAILISYYPAENEYSKIKLVAGDLGCGFWPNFSHFIVDLIMQATLFDHNRNWYRKKLKEEVDICQCNRAIHRYHQGLSRSGVH